MEILTETIRLLYIIIQRNLCGMTADWKRIVQNFIEYEIWYVGLLKRKDKF